jgi:hyperosmotically inducible periplasmic protein
MSSKDVLFGIPILVAAIALPPFAFARESAGSPAASPSTEQSASTSESVKQSAKSGASDVKEGAENAGSAIARTAKRAYHKSAAFVKDSVLTTKAKAELMSNQATNESTIHVSTHRGVVTLTGQVDSKEKAEQAQEVVARIDGVKNIRNELIYPGSATGPAPSAPPVSSAPAEPTAPAENMASPVH